MVTYLGSLISVVLWGGRNASTKHHWHVWGALAVSGPHRVWPRSRRVLSQFTLLRLRVSLPGSCLRRALGCEHFPGLSGSGAGSRVLHRGTDSAGPAFCALPRSEQVRRPGAWRATLPQVGGASYHLPVPAARFPGWQWA